jgi:hypothetical protein
MERVRFWVSQGLGKPAKIFFDARSIGNGVNFDQSIDDALKHSTVIISVMSPLYFASAYCLAEIETFILREDKLGYSRGSLISCAHFHDGESFPIRFARLQAVDFTPFANTEKAFWDSADAVVFSPRIKNFGIAIAEKIKAAPEWSSDFPDPPYDPDSGIAPPPIKRPAAYLEQAGS